MKKKKAEHFVHVTKDGNPITITLTNYDYIDADDVTSIHHHNPIGEMLTTPVALNRVGNMLSEAEYNLNMSKLNFDIFIAKEEDKKRKELTFVETTAKGVEKVKSPTIGEVDSAVKSTKEFKMEKEIVFSAEKKVGMLKSLYWALKSKDNKIDKMISNLKPEEFEKEIIEDVVNGIKIRTHKAAIK